MPPTMSEWIRCPVCGRKMRLQKRKDTELKNFPLFCPKCKQETLINVKDDIQDRLQAQLMKAIIQFRFDK